MDAWEAVSSVERYLYPDVFFAIVMGVKNFCLALDFKKNVFIFQIREGKDCMKL